jgi:hypothetical protein
MRKKMIQGALVALHEQAHVGIELLLEPVVQHSLSQVLSFPIEMAGGRQSPEKRFAIHRRRFMPRSFQSWIIFAGSGNEECRPRGSARLTAMAISASLANANDTANDTARKYAAIWNGDSWSSFEGFRFLSEKGLRSGAINFPM